MMAWVTSNEMLMVALNDKEDDGTVAAVQDNEDSLEENPSNDDCLEVSLMKWQQVMQG